MKVYQPLEPPLKEPQLPPLPTTPQKYGQAESSLLELQQELDKRDLSSLMRGKASTILKGTANLFAYLQIVIFELDQSRAQAKALQMSRTRSRQVL
jgi:hypothetical protein